MQPKIRRVGDRSIVPVKHGSLAPGAGEQVEGGRALAPVPGKLKTVENVGNLCELVWNSIIYYLLKYQLFKIFLNLPVLMWYVPVLLKNRAQRSWIKNVYFIFRKEAHVWLHQGVVPYILLCIPSLLNFFTFQPGAFSYCNWARIENNSENGLREDFATEKMYKLKKIH